MDGMIAMMFFMGGISFLLMLSGIFSDILWPWMESMRKPRPQATRRK